MIQVLCLHPPFFSVLTQPAGYVKRVNRVVEKKERERKKEEIKEKENMKYAYQKKKKSES